MRTAASCLRAVACAGLAVATLFTVAPVTFASAPTTPAATIPEQGSPERIALDFLVPDLVAPDLLAAGAPPDLITPDLITPDLIAGPLDLPAALPVSLLTGGAQNAILDALTPPTLLLTGAAGLTSAPATVVKTTAAAALIAKARSHLGARYVHGAKGPRVFDCIGLVLRSYADAGLISRIGGWANSSGYSLYAWGRRHHLTSTTQGKPGDVVVWGGGAHVGIYLGNGMAISALVSGVRVHGVHAVTNRFTTFIHTGLTAVQVKAVAKTAHASSIGVRHAGPSLVLRAGHSTGDRLLSTLKSGTKLTLLSIWHDAKGRTWYRVNANKHVGWVAGWLTRA